MAPPADTIESRFIAINDLLQDVWQDAEMDTVLSYLRGGLGQQLPPEWRRRIPMRRSDYVEAP